MPKISVVIPIYGVEKYIERCATCLFEQTLDDIEYIFVDDCTIDRSIEILESIIGRYRIRLATERKTVRIERMPTNKGLPAVRRHGVQLATGDYIVHCDSDDWVDTDMYRAMYEKAVEDKADVVVCDFKRVNGEGNTINVVTACHSKQIHKFREDIVFQKVPWSLWNKLFKKSCYENVTFAESNLGEDMVVVIQLLQNCSNITYVPIPLYYYRYNADSITHEVDADKVIKNYYGMLHNISLLSDSKLFANMFCYYRDNLYLFAKINLFYAIHSGLVKQCFLDEPRPKLSVLLDFRMNFKIRVVYLYCLISSIIYKNKHNRRR